MPEVQLKRPRRRLLLGGVALALGAATMPSAVWSADGTAHVQAWGSNINAQLGVPGLPATDLGSTTPVTVEGLGPVAELSVGASGSHALVRLTDGTVWAWGLNKKGQLGIPDSTPRSATPLEVAGLTGVSQLSAGRNHSLALKDTRVWAWGDNSCGQLGNPVAGPPVGIGPKSAARVRVRDAGDPSGFLSGVTSISAGGNFNLALRADGTLWAWGQNENGQLGNGAQVFPAGGGGTCDADTPARGSGPAGPWQDTPSRVAVRDRVVAFSAGRDHALAVTDDGTVWAWGLNWNGQLGSPSGGNDTVLNSAVPAPVSGLPTAIVDVAAGADFSLALAADGRVWAWGLADALGGDGDGSPAQQRPAGSRVRTKPVQVEDASDPTGFLTNVVRVDSGYQHAVAITSGDRGGVFAWGKNGSGQVGDGTTTTAAQAVRVLDVEVATVGAGQGHSVAVLGARPERPSAWAPGGSPLPELPPGPTPPELPESKAPDVSEVQKVVGDLVESIVGPDGLLEKFRDDNVPPPPNPAEGFPDLDGPGPTGVGSVLVTGHAADVWSQVYPCTEQDDLHCVSPVGPQQFVRRAVAYVTPRVATPRLLLAMNRRYRRAADGIKDAGFVHPCPKPPVPTPLPGCFDIAYRSDLQPNATGQNPYTSAFQPKPDVALESVNFYGYDAVVVSTNLLREELNVLEDRRSELFAYVNAGGGLLAFPQIYGAAWRDPPRSEVSYDTYPPDRYYYHPEWPCERNGGIPGRPEWYGECLRFVPFLEDRYYPYKDDTNMWRSGRGDGIAYGPNSGITVTREGRDMGLTEADVNGFPVSKWFFEPCGFDVMDQDSDGKALTLGTHKPIPSPCFGLDVPDVSVHRPREGSVPATFTVSLTQPRPEPLALEYTTADGSATLADDDYEKTSGTLTFEPGEATKTVTVQVLGKATAQASEHFLLRLRTADDALQLVATASILDDVSAKNEEGGSDNAGTGADGSRSETAPPPQPPAPAGGAASAPAPAVAPAAAVAPAPALASAPALAQALSQAQAQASAQANAQSNAQANAQSNAQAHAPQAAVALQRERQAQVEQAGQGLNASSSQELLASGRRAEHGPALAIGLTMAFLGVGLAFGPRRRAGPALATALDPPGSGPRRSERHGEQLRRLRGQR